MRRLIFLLLLLFVVPTLLLAACSDADDGAADISGDVKSAADDALHAAFEEEPGDPVGAAEQSASDEDDADPGTGASGTTGGEPTGAADETTGSADDPTPQLDFSAIAPIIEANIAEHELNGAGLVIVEADAGVVFEQHWGVFEPDRVSLIASATKMITAGVLLHLDDQGLLDIDAPIADVVDWGAANPDITPAQLLSNSSGLVGLFPDPAFAPYLCQYLAAGTLQECGEAIFTTTADDADVVAPDTEFRYGGAQWQVAGAVAELASGKTWDRLIEEIYVEPCGLESLEYNNHFGQLAGGFSYPEAFDGDPSILTATANPNMEGGAIVTTGDYAQLLLMHLRGGVCGDTQVLSSEALAQMHADRIAEEYGGDGFTPDRGYGMGWWVQRETGRIDDPGAYGAFPWLDLDDGYGAYLIVESQSVIGAEIAAELAEPVHEAMTTAG
jgi:CubicO group peptidase (beta-lactamase class C family)